MGFPYGVEGGGSFRLDPHQYRALNEGSPLDERILGAPTAVCFSVTHSAR
jgi:hypothetical protein